MHDIALEQVFMERNIQEDRALFRLGLMSRELFFSGIAVREQRLGVLSLLLKGIEEEIFNGTTTGGATDGSGACIGHGDGAL